MWRCDCAWPLPGVMWQLKRQLMPTDLIFGMV